MSDPVVPVPPTTPTVQIGTVPNGVLPGSVTAGVISAANFTPIVPRDTSARTPPKNVRSSVDTQTAASVKALQNSIRSVLAAKDAPVVETPAAEPVVDAPSTDIPASLLGVEPVVAPAPVAEPTPPPEVAKDAKAAYTWAQLRKEKHDAEVRAVAAVADAEAKAAEAMRQTELAVAMKKERDEIDGQLQKTNLLESPAFKARYDGRIAEQRALLANTFAQVMEAPQVEAIVNQVLHAPVKEFSELLGKVPAWAQQLVLTTRATVQQVSADREKAVSDWRTTRVALAEQESKDQRIKLVTELESETAKAVENAAKLGNYMLAKTGDAAWDAKVAERVTKMKATLAQPRSRQDIVDLVAEGITAAETRTELAKVYQENAALKSQLTKLGMRPASAVSPAGAPPPPPAAAAKPVKMRDFISASMGKITSR